MASTAEAKWWHTSRASSRITTAGCIWWRALPRIRRIWPMPSCARFTPSMRACRSTTSARCRKGCTIRWPGSASLARQRFATAMLGAFAAFALLLAAVGVYGVMSYLVTQSTHDIGVRVALGAQSGHILGLVVRQGMALAVVGIVAGLIGSAALTRLMASLLFGVSATDAVTFGSVAAILAAVVCAATVIPARRATGVDPMVALRDE